MGRARAPTAALRRQMRRAVPRIATGFSRLPALRLMEDPALERGRDGGRAIADAELLEDVFDVPLGRRAADVQLGRDFVVGQAPCQEPQHLDLARREVRANPGLLQTLRRFTR